MELKKIEDASAKWITEYHSSENDKDLTNLCVAQFTPYFKAGVEWINSINSEEKSTVKWILKLEIRYDISIFNEEVGDYNYEYVNDKFYSKLFDSEIEAIKYGNKLIADNLWMEQTKERGQILKRKYGYPLVVFRLKNRAQIFISVKKSDILTFEDLNTELRKLQVDKITNNL